MDARDFKAELQADIEALATKDDFLTAIREEEERTRRHMDVVVESILARIDLILAKHLGR